MAVNTVREIRWLFRPWFWILDPPEEFKADTTNIKDFYKALPEKPALLKETSLLTLGGPLSTLFGLFNATIGLAKESSLTKIFGGLLTIVGIGSAIAGRVFRVRFKEEEKSVEKGREDKKLKQKPPATTTLAPTPQTQVQPEPELTENNLTEDGASYLPFSPPI